MLLVKKATDGDLRGGRVRFEHLIGGIAVQWPDDRLEPVLAAPDVNSDRFELFRTPIGT